LCPHFLFHFPLQGLSPRGKDYIGIFGDATIVSMHTQDHPLSLVLVGMVNPSLASLFMHLQHALQAA
jgi:hypothetical protein